MLLPAILLLTLLRGAVMLVSGFLFDSYISSETQHIRNLLKYEVEKMGSMLNVIEQMNANDIQFTNSELEIYKSSNLFQNIALAYFDDVKKIDTENMDIWVASSESPYKIISTTKGNDFIGRNIEDIEKYSIQYEIKNILDDVGYILKHTGNGYLEFEHQYSSLSDTVTTRIVYVMLYKPENWIIGAGIDLKHIQKTAIMKVEYEAKIEFVYYLTLAISLFSALGVAFISFIYGRRLSLLLQIINNRIENLSQGISVYKIFNKQNKNDELDVIVSNLNALIEGLDKYKMVVQNIANGKFDTQIVMKNKTDELGAALVEMQKNLTASEIKMKQKNEEEALRRWTAEGLALFATLLRDSTKNTREVSVLVIRNLVNYLNANIGAVYLLNSENKENTFLEMTACFAYDRNKLAGTKISTDEGLIGKVFNEGNTLVLDNVPTNYLYITSGLGKHEPKNLMLVPLNYNDETLGVIELASLNEFSKTQIDFVEKVSESISASFSMIIINTETNALLQQAEAQKNEMLAKEKRLKEMIDELQNVHAQASDNQSKGVSFANAINHTFIRADINLYGVVTYVNTHFLWHFDFESIDVANKHFSYFIQDNYIQMFDNLFDTVVTGGKHFEGLLHFKARRTTFNMISTFTAIRDNNNKISSILFLGIMPQDKTSSEGNFVVPTT